MIKGIARRGYGGVTVREVVRRAGVSTRAFYEHFDGKEDCFLRTYEMVVRRALQRIVASQAGEPDWRTRLLIMFKEFTRGLEGDPEGARFALIEAYAGGPTGLGVARRAERTFELMLGESIARGPNGVVVAPLIVEGLVAGAASVVRARLRIDRDSEIMELGAELIEWASSYLSESANALAELDVQSVWRNTTLEPLILPSSTLDGEAWPSRGDRALLLSGVSKLFVASGYGKLTTTHIRFEAKVSGKVFNANFDGVEACFLAALEQKAAEASAQVARAQAAGRSWPGGVYRGIAALCDQVANDPFLARVCLVNDSARKSFGAQRRSRLLAAFVEQLGESVPLASRPSELVSEASNGAIWALFHHHIVRDWTQRRQLAATLAFLALAPIVGADAAVSAIRREQTA